MSDPWPGPSGEAGNPELCVLVAAEADSAFLSSTLLFPTDESQSVPPPPPDATPAPPALTAARSRASSCIPACSLTRLRLPSCRDLRQSAVRHRHLLRRRPPLRLALRLLEALLVAMAGQGRRRPEPDVRTASRERRHRGPGRRLAVAASDAAEGRPLVLVALPVLGPAPPPLL